MFEKNENDKLDPTLENAEAPRTEAQPPADSGPSAPEAPAQSAPSYEYAEAPGQSPEPETPSPAPSGGESAFSGEPVPQAAGGERPFSSEPVSPGGVAAPAGAGQETPPPAGETASPAPGGTPSYYGTAAPGGSAPVPPAYGAYPGGQPSAYPQPPYGAAPAGANEPPQQTQWTFNDYGPIGGPQKPKKPKKERAKEDRTPGNSTGVKVLAIVMSVLFVLSVAGFSGYIIYDNSRKNDDSAPASSEPYHIQEPPAVSETPDTSTPAVTSGNEMTPAELYKAVEPSVVGIVGYYRSSTTGIYEPASQGSGVVFDSNGYIVTNRHVIKNPNEQNWDKIEVIRTTGETYTAEVLGSDRETDLAVLKIEDVGLTAAVLGDSDKLQVGDQAFVIGNPSGVKFAGSLAGGYISAVNREVLLESTNSRVQLIQTDAAINPGNSGGALVNIYGQVIGITSAKLVGEEYEGMGFAIPINDVKPIVESLVDSGYVTGRVEIGLTYQVIEQTIADLNGIPQGLRVVTVDQTSDAHAKGLLPGDIIYRMDGVEVHDTPDVKQALLNKNPGEQLLLSVYRVGSDDRAQKLELSVTLREKAAEE